MVGPMINTQSTMSEQVKTTPGILAEEPWNTKMPSDIKKYSPLATVEKKYANHVIADKKLVCT